jgi:ATP/maltotriose-dependent transcriptional regulator MalT
MEGERRGEILLDLCRARRAARDLAGAREVADEVLTIAQAAGDTRLEWHARLQASGISLETDPEGAAQEVFHGAQTAIPFFEAMGDEKGLAAAWLTMSDAYNMWSQQEARQHAAEEGIGHARAAGVMPAGLTSLAAAIFLGPAPVLDSIARFKELLDEWGEHRLVRGQILQLLAGLLGMVGEFEEARSAFAEARKTYDDLGVPHLHGDELPGDVEMLAGDPIAAERAWRSAMAVREHTGEKGVFSTLAALVAHALCAQGRYGEALTYVQVSRESGSTDDTATQVLYRTALAKIRVSEGDSDQAVHLAREAVDLSVRSDSPNLRGSAFLDLAEVLMAANDAVGAAAAAQDALAEFERKGNTVMAARARAFLEKLGAHCQFSVAAPAAATSSRAQVGHRLRGKERAPECSWVCMLECICMRTTVEITEEQRLALTALAAKRGLRGFSPLVQEAIDLYLGHQQADRLEAVLALRGVLTASEADEMERRIAEAWSTWSTAS